MGGPGSGPGLRDQRQLRELQKGAEWGRDIVVARVAEDECEMIHRRRLFDKHEAWRLWYQVLVGGE
jgi:hypothetical protein